MRFFWVGRAGQVGGACVFLGRAGQIGWRSVFLGWSSWVGRLGDACLTSQSRLDLPVLRLFGFWKEAGGAWMRLATQVGIVRLELVMHCVPRRGTVEDGGTLTKWTH